MNGFTRLRGGARQHYQEMRPPDRPRSLIIFKDDHPWDVLTEHLLTQGIKPVVVSTGLGLSPSGQGPLMVRPGERQDYDLLLRNIREDGRTLGHIFHLWSIPER